MKTSYKVTGCIDEEIGLYAVKLDTMVLGYTETEDQLVQTMKIITRALRKTGLEVEIKMEQSYGHGIITSR